MLDLGSHLLELSGQSFFALALRCVMADLVCLFWLYMYSSASLSDLYPDFSTAPFVPSFFLFG